MVFDHHGPFSVDGGRLGWCPCVVAGAASLAGRAGPLRVVSALLVGESDAAGMLIVGEAGVGKSRLAAAGAAAATRSGVLVLWGWCLRLSDGMPFLPVADVLRELSE